MVNAPADIVRQLLVDAGYTWPITYDSELDRPDDVITVYDTQPRVDSDNMQDPDLHYGIQVRIRSADTGVGRDKSESIRATLNAVNRQSVTVDANLYTVNAFSQVMVLKLGKDGATTRRSLYVVNCVASIIGLSVGTPDLDGRYRYFPRVYF